MSERAINHCGSRSFRSLLGRRRRRPTSRPGKWSNHGSPEAKVDLCWLRIAENLHQFAGGSPASDQRLLPLLAARSGQSAKAPPTNTPIAIFFAIRNLLGLFRWISVQARN